MKIEKLFAVLVASAVLQTMSVAGQDVFRVSFTGSIRPGSGNRVAQRLGNSDLIEQCVGTGSTAKELNQKFALVYNATEDSIQVVNRADGTVVCDVFQFQGGTSRVVQNQLVRLTFVFAHDQPDSVGSAVITERPNRSNVQGVRPKVSGKVQFSLPNDVTTTSTDTTNTDVTVTDTTTTTVETPAPSGNFVQATALANSTTDQRVAVGNFVVGRTFVSNADAAATASARKAARKNKSNNAATSTNMTSTDTTSTATTTQENSNVGTEPGTQGSQTPPNVVVITPNTNNVPAGTNSLTTTNGLGGINTSILTLFPGNLNTR